MSNWVIIPSDSDILHYGKKGQKWGIRNKKQSGASKKTGRVMNNNSKNGTAYGEYDIHPDFNTAMQRGVNAKDLDNMEEAMWSIQNGKKPNWKSIDKVILKMNLRERNNFIKRMKRFNSRIYFALKSRYQSSQKKGI